MGADTTLDYKDLLNGAAIFEQDYGSDTSSERIYTNSVTPNYIHWNNFQNNDADRVFSFLNVWGRCRMKCSPADLMAHYQEFAPFLNKLTTLKLEEANFNQLIACGTETMALKRVVHFIFDAISNIKGFGPVPASKTLHIASPSLLVMWDNPICSEVYRELNMKPNGYFYAYVFMPKMKQELEVILSSCMQSKGLSRRDAIQWLLSEIERIHGTKRSLAKAIDEYNWLRGKKLKQ